MYKDVLRSLSDVSIFPIISILIFFAFFMVLLIWVLQMKKESISLMANIPINDNPPPQAAPKKRICKCGDACKSKKAGNCHSHKHD